jgi:hypothetical protein
VFVGIHPPDIFLSFVTRYIYSARVRVAGQIVCRAPKYVDIRVWAMCLECWSLGDVGRCRCWIEHSGECAGSEWRVGSGDCGDTVQIHLGAYELIGLGG